MSRTSEAPQRFLLRGLDPSLAGARGLVRVRVALVADPVGRAGAAPRLRARLQARLNTDDIRLLRADPAAGIRLARRRETARDSALTALQRSTRIAAESQARLARAIARAGGRVLEADPVTNTLLAEAPARALPSIAARADVQAIEAAPDDRPLAAVGLGLSTAVVGAPSFWAAGHSGGRGAADRSTVDLAIVNDKIQQDHPAFTGITFQTPPGLGPSSYTDHGPAVASMAISRGASGCPKCASDDAQKKGIAPGLDTVLDASPENGNGIVWALGLDQPLYPDGFLPGAADPAEVMNDSHGSPATADDDMYTQSLDTYTSSFGTTIALPSGNAGPVKSVHSGCIAYNALCMGAYDYWGTQDPADDRIPDFSSRGPSPAGRKKPDLVAIGVTEYAERRWADSTKGLWSYATEGTSFASPQGAGAAALLAGSGITDANLQKAILVNSARLGRATPEQAMGTQAGWQPDWGWGALDLDAALDERTNGAVGDVSGGGARFYRATSVAAADRTTLVWYRRSTADCYTGRCGPQPLTLTNLDLQQLDPATGAVQSQSSSTIDNVEQVRSPAPASTAIYKVKATSSVDGLPGEPFALAAARPLTALTTPQPAVALDVAAGVRRAGEPVTVTATARNPSPDLTAEDAGVTLQLPDGVELKTGEQTRSLGTLATGSPTQTLTWTVEGTSDGLKSIAVRAQASRYGETFATTSAGSFTVDASAPEPSIAAPEGTTRERSLALAWGAADAHSGIAHYDVEAALDGTGWSPWLTQTALTQASYAGVVGHRYRFRVRATDTLGNSSGWVESSEAAIADPPAPPEDTPTVVAPTRKAAPAVTLTRVKRTRTGVALDGRIDPAATGGVTVVYSTKSGRRTYRSRLFVSVKRGRFRAALPLPARARRAKRGTARIAYRGDQRFAPQTVTRIVNAR
jgi:hypothetical protein